MIWAYYASQGISSLLLGEVASSDCPYTHHHFHHPPCHRLGGWDVCDLCLVTVFLCLCAVPFTLVSLEGCGLNGDGSFPFFPLAYQNHMVRLQIFSLRQWKVDGSFITQQESAEWRDFFCVWQFCRKLHGSCFHGFPSNVECGHHFGQE